MKPAFFPQNPYYSSWGGAPAAHPLNGYNNITLYTIGNANSSSPPSSTPNQTSDPNGFHPVDFRLSIGVTPGIKLRTDTYLNAPYEGVTNDTAFQFDGWKYGEAVQDRTVANGQMDALWLHVKGTNYWIPSAFMIGYPPGYKPPVSSGGSNGNNGNTGGSNTGGNSGTLLLQPVDASYFLARPQFYTTGNPFFPYNAPVSVGGTGGLPANCTWYASGRVKEMGGSPEALSSMLGNAGTWGNNLSHGSRIVYQPQVGDIAEWTRDGHVAVVEQVNSDGSIVISESNYARILHHIRTIYPDQVGTKATGWPDRFIRVPKNGNSTGNTSAKGDLIRTGGGGYSYSRNEAVSYARTYAYNRNSVFTEYENNCASFVSQCLYAGGLLNWHELIDEVKTTLHNNPIEDILNKENNGVYLDAPFWNANALPDYLRDTRQVAQIVDISNYSPDERRKKINELMRPGDVIAYGYNENNDEIGHVALYLESKEFVGPIAPGHQRPDATPYVAQQGNKENKASEYTIKVPTLTTPKLKLVLIQA